MAEVRKRIDSKDLSYHHNTFSYFHHTYNISNVVYEAIYLLNDDDAAVSPWDALRHDEDDRIDQLEEGDRVKHMIQVEGKCVK